MKRLLLLVIVVALGVVAAYQPARDSAIAYGKVALSAMNAGIVATRAAMNSDLEQCQNGSKEQRIACTKRHEAALDKLHPDMDSAGQQDKLYKAMEQ